MESLGEQIFGNRYQLLNKLGEGGMGAVYRAYDRLNRQIVALKRVTTPTSDSERPTHSAGDSTVTRVALAHEFQTLASLRHPHIINVLDYGFDSSGQPYFTMSLLENPQSITQAGKEYVLDEQISLLVQMLQALAYLHRRGIIHRDLKPDNALVSADGEVKVLDFGLATLREREQGTDGVSGTIAYMAPEIIQGSDADEASDLYAVGVMAYEILAGEHPFDTSNIARLIPEILSMPPDLTKLDAGSDIAYIVQRLLEKEPDFRYKDAYEIITTLSYAVSQPIPQETAAIRESFLQAAKFVGRDKELSQLTEALTAALKGQGNAWLIGGESGVGKSRLLDELRTRAMVKGALALHGQGVVDGGLAYQLWRDILRRLALGTELNDIDASVLKQIVPDIGELIGRSVPDAPDLDGAAGQQRLLQTIISLFHKQTQPVVLVLEDLQWMIESLDVLKLLNTMVQTLPLLIIGTYRDDEKPDLPAELPGMQVLKLERLNSQGIEELSVSMLGEVGRQPEVLELLKKETEGNIFFLVEVVRALAEQAGRLTEIGRTALPQHVFAGGIQQVVEQRLKRVPDDARKLLNAAAISSRLLDLNLLAAIDPTIKIDDWLSICSNAAVLDVLDGQWRFAHEKLREGLVSSLDPDQQRTLHLTTAETLQRIYADNLDEYAASISEHYEDAGELSLAAVWHARAGKHAQETYAPLAAINSYQKALALWTKKETGELSSQQVVERFPIYEGLGEMLNWQARYADAIEVFTKLGTAAETAGDAAVQSRALLGLAKAQTYRGELQAANESATKAETIARKSNIKVELTQALWMKGWTAFRLGDMANALPLSEEVLTLSTELNSRSQMAETLNLLGVVHYMMGHYDQTAVYFDQAQKISEEIGNRPRAMSLLNNLGVLASAKGDFKSAVTRYQDALAMAHEIGQREAEMVYQTNLGGAYVGLVQYAEAESILTQVVSKAERDGLGELSETLRFLAQAYLGQHKVEDALSTASRALSLGLEVGSQEYIGAAWRVLGEVATFTGDPVSIQGNPDEATRTCDAVECFTESLKILKEAGIEGEQAQTLRAWAKYELAHGDQTRGASMWHEARDHFDRLGAEDEVKRMDIAPESIAGSQ